MSAEKNLANLGITLPSPPAKGGVYTPVVVTGNLAYVSGHISLDLDGSLIAGKVGRDLTADEAKEAARKTGYLLLSTLRSQFGSLDKLASASDEALLEAGLSAETVLHLRKTLQP